MKFSYLFINLFHIPLVFTLANQDPELKPGAELFKQEATKLVTSQSVNLEGGDCQAFVDSFADKFKYCDHTEKDKCITDDKEALLNKCNDPKEEMSLLSKFKVLPFREKYKDSDQVEGISNFTKVAIKGNQDNFVIVQKFVETEDGFKSNFWQGYHSPGSKRVQEDIGTVGRESISVANIVFSSFGTNCTSFMNTFAEKFKYCDDTLPECITDRNVLQKQCEDQGKMIGEVVKFAVLPSWDKVEPGKFEENYSNVVMIGYQKSPIFEFFDFANVLKLVQTSDGMKVTYYGGYYIMGDPIQKKPEDDKDEL